MTHWIVYRNITDFPRDTFERLPTPKPGMVVVRNNILPGMYGYPDMFIRRHHVHVDGHTVNLITYTERELSAAEAFSLAERGLKELQ